MHDEHFIRYIALCKRIYERMERDDDWSFLEPSQIEEGAVESDDNHEHV